MYLLFNMLSWLIITFLPRSKCLLISWLQSPYAVILEPPKIKSDTVSCREPVWGTPPMAKVMRKEAWHCTKAGSSLRRPPVPEHLPPKPESAYFTVLCSHLYLWLYGGLPLITSLTEGVNVQLQSIKIPGRDKSVSTYKLLWRFSSLPEQVRQATCDCFQPPNHERHKML